MTLAKKDFSTPDDGRVKIRFFEFEVEGSNATLTEGIRNLASVITRGNGATTPVRVITSTNGSGATPLAGGAPPEGDVEFADTEVPEPKPAAARKTGGRGARLRVSQDSTGN